jgi:flavin reductase (DIM6/NTAB) family NADH-FMN oxidoreductase RutF
LPEWFEQAHQTSARYAAGVSEFEQCGFKEMLLPNFSAPFVAESTVKIGLELRETVDIKLNGTTLVIGEIVQILVDNENLVAADGYVDHIKAKTVTVTGLDAYFSASELSRLPYAKPNVMPSI